MKILESFDEFNKKLDNLKTVSDDAKKIKNGIREIIENLPNNDKINKLGKSNAFTISTKDLNISKSLDPFYYDFKAQYKKISEYLDKINLEDFNDKYNEIIKKEKFILNQHPYKLNPEVIVKLKDLLK